MSTGSNSFVFYAVLGRRDRVGKSATGANIMPLNIIVRDKRSLKERTIQRRGQEILARCYKTECESPEKFGLPGKPTKAEIKRAWEHDARGDIDPAL